jgi:hypothetical protein
MITMKKLLFFCMATCLLVACDRDIKFDTISVTPPTLTVQVEGVMVNNTYPKMEGATVQLYNSDNTLLATKTTDTAGRVVFSKAELKKEGTFKAVATKGALTGNATSSYMLLNDGNTLLTVTIQ